MHIASGPQFCSTCNSAVRYTTYSVPRARRIMFVDGPNSLILKSNFTVRTDNPASWPGQRATESQMPGNLEIVFTRTSVLNTFLTWNSGPRVSRSGNLLWPAISWGRFLGDLAVEFSDPDVSLRELFNFPRIRVRSNWSPLFCASY